MKHSKAAGSTILKLARNLSRMLHCCVLVAATVVSEINDKLSPKNDPPTTAATIKGKGSPTRTANSVATGTKATMVPTEVPTQSDTTQAATKSPASKILSGRYIKVRSTVAPTAPMVCADLANAPANTKIHTIKSKSVLPAPREKTATRSCTL